MDELQVIQGLQELADRFAPRQAITSLHIDNAIALKQLAEEIFGTAEARDRDLENLVRYAAKFYEPQLADIEQRALLRGGLAFLFVQYVPNEHDYFLIQRASPRTRVMHVKTKQVRDTWAFMVYKRTLAFDPEQSYTAKPGQTLRPKFRDLLVAALGNALRAGEDFRNEARRLAREQLDSLVLASPAEVSENIPDKNHPDFDLSEFIAETVSDGTLVPIGETFTKTWTLRNAGNVPWINRQIKRITPMTPLYPYSVQTVPIPDTLPGEKVVIAVEITTKRVAGFVEVRFKMAFEDGELCWPNQYPYGLTVAVEAGDLVWVYRQNGVRHES